MPRQYITTAIDTPNAPPHMGHAMERILADVIARWMRLRGDEVRFQVGTDEHGLKMQRTAEKESITPEKLLKRNVPLFRKLCDDLCISYDVFFETHNDVRHAPTVLELWKKLKKAGKLEKRNYTSQYCVGCERFMTKRDLVDGMCPNHKSVPEEVTEENWFFLLGEDSEKLHNLLTKKWDDETYRILPEFRAKETLSLLDQGLEDVSFSRPKKSLSWGIPVPEDEEQTMYVWCDALTNYISGLEYLTDREDASWWDEAEVTHIIGKDIARFHALYWPAMLKHSGVRTPDRLLIHGFVTSEGQKMSKTLGNIVTHDQIIDQYGVDPLRFYLSHEVPVGRDGDFSWDRMRSLYDAKLRNDIGNLLNRVIVMIQKCNEITISDKSLLLTDHWGRYKKAMDEFRVSEAIQIPCQLATECNRYIDEEKPWDLDGDERKIVLGDLAEGIRHIALMLLPFMPQTAEAMTKQLGVPYANTMQEKTFTIDNKNLWNSQKSWKFTDSPEILFAPLDS